MGGRKIETKMEICWELGFVGERTGRCEGVWGRGGDLLTCSAPCVVHYLYSGLPDLYWPTGKWQKIKCLLLDLERYDLNIKLKLKNNVGNRVTLLHKIYFYLIISVLQYNIFYSPNRSSHWTAPARYTRSTVATPGIVNLVKREIWCFISFLPSSKLQEWIGVAAAAFHKETQSSDLLTH